MLIDSFNYINKNSFRDLDIYYKYCINLHEKGLEQYNTNHIFSKKIYLDYFGLCKNLYNEHPLLVPPVLVRSTAIRNILLTNIEKNIYNEGLDNYLYGNSNVILQAYIYSLLYGFSLIGYDRTKIEIIPYKYYYPCNNLEGYVGLEKPLDLSNTNYKLILNNKAGFVTNLLKLLLDTSLTLDVGVQALKNSTGGLLIKNTLPEDTLQYGRIASEAEEAKKRNEYAKLIYESWKMGEDIRHNGIGVVSDKTAIEQIDTASNGITQFKDYIDTIKYLIQENIIGQSGTISQQEYGSYARGVISSQVSSEIALSDEQNIIEIGNYIINDLGAVGNIVTEKENPTNISAQLDILSVLSDNSFKTNKDEYLEIDLQWLSEQLNIKFANSTDNTTIKLTKNVATNNDSFY